MSIEDKIGFTLIEIILVVAVVAGVFSFSAVYGLNFYRTQLVNEAQSVIVNVLQTARQNSILQKNDSAFGVDFVSVPNNYVLFQGSGYLSRTPSQDQIYSINDNIILESDFSEIVFSKLVGLPSATGTVRVSYGSISRDILINDSGQVLKGE